MRRLSFSIHQKLVALIVASMLVVVAFLASYQSSQQIAAMTNSLCRRAATYGSVMAPQVTSAVAFADKETAREVLRSVNADTDVTAVVLYGDSGATLYRRGTSTVTASAALQATTRSVIDKGSRIAVITPVISIEGPRGALVIELSTAPLKEAQARIVWLAVLTGTGALLSGVVLAWQLARGIARRLRAIANLATSVSEGDLSHEPIMDSQRDEIGSLANAFNAMLEQIKEHNERLERLVAQRTVQLEQRTAEMQLVFDHVDQGFMVVDLGGSIASQRSAAVERWLGELPASANLCDYVRSFAPESAVWFDVQWNALSDDLLPIEVCVAQLPSRFQVAGRHLEFSYQPLSDGQPSRILVVATDVTARERRRSAERDERETSSLVARMLRGRAAFLAFHAEGAHYADVVSTAALDDTTFRRAVHTLKGICSLQGIDSISELCHELETAIEKGDLSSATAACARILARWLFVTAKIRPLMEVAADGVDVSNVDLRRFRVAERRGAGRTELVEMVVGWGHERLSGRLQRFAEDAAALAERLGKAPLAVVVEVDDSLRLPPGEWEPFWSAFVHAIRNAIDHGVNSIENGKRATSNQLVLRALHVADRIAIEVQDFGAGIDWARIEAIALSRGMPVGTRTELEAALFADGVSTRDVVTQTSGRGVGMAVLREACERIGGHIAVSSQRGRGTTLIFSWPCPAAPSAHQLAV